MLRETQLLAVVSVAQAFAPTHRIISIRPAIASRATDVAVLARINPAARITAIAPASPGVTEADSAQPLWRHLILRVRSASIALFCAFILAMSAPSAATAAPTLPTTTMQQQSVVRLRAAPARKPSRAKSASTQQTRIVYRSVLEVPQATDCRITDLAGYRLEASARLADAIVDFESRVDAPVFVVTLPSIGTPKSGVKSFATRLFNEWQIGSYGTQRGVLVLIVKDVRRVEVEVGTRLNSVVSRSWTTRMLEHDVTPTLKGGAYAHGVEQAIGRLASRIAGGKPSVSSPPLEVQDALYALGLGAVGIGYGVNAVAEDRKSRTCDACGSVVTQGPVNPVEELRRQARAKLSPPSDPLGLNPITNPKPNMGMLTDTKRIGAWKTIKPATYDHAGQRKRTLRCHKCGAVSTKVQTIPRKVEATSSSYGGSDGGSDGGGGGGGDF